MNRREFARGSLLAAAGVACSRLFSTDALASSQPKRILVLGGTRFLGPAIVDAAIAEGHTVTLFNRGLTHPELFPFVEKLRGFRSARPSDENFSAIGHRHFDVVIDVWPNDPALAASAAAFLKDLTDHYVYVSSVAAYDSKEFTKRGITESAPLEPWDGPARPYNRGKAESERRLHAIVGERLTIVRPGPIKGTRDTTPDLLAWLIRAQRGGRHIGPGDGSDEVELVDVKDVARFLMLAVDGRLYGTFNVTGRPMTFRAFLDACNAATRSDAQFVWIPEAFLRQQGLETDFALGLFAGNFPLWRPAGALPGLWQVSSDKAFGAGWRTRPFDETAWDCLSFFHSRGEDLGWQDYLPADKEAQVLEAWSHRSSSRPDRGDSRNSFIAAGRGERHGSDG